jgi:hypothetical protein
MIINYDLIYLPGYYEIRLGRHPVYRFAISRFDYMAGNVYLSFNTDTQVKVLKDDNMHRLITNFAQQKIFEFQHNTSYFRLAFGDPKVEIGLYKLLRYRDDSHCVSRLCIMSHLQIYRFLDDMRFIHKPYMYHNSVGSEVILYHLRELSHH